jgi:hypothetical protein
MPDTMIPAERAGELAELKHSLAAHPFCDAVDSAEHLKVFLQHHVVCVFDFMSLLKSLQ